jgi:hypothetical protein
MPSFKPETCEDVEDDEDEAPLALDAGKIFIFENVSRLSHTAGKGILFTFDTGNQKNEWQELSTTVPYTSNVWKMHTETIYLRVYQKLTKI